MNDHPASKRLLAEIEMVVSKGVEQSKIISVNSCRFSILEVSKSITVIIRKGGIFDNGLESEGHGCTRIQQDV